MNNDDWIFVIVYCSWNHLIISTWNLLYLSASSRTINIQFIRYLNRPLIGSVPLYRSAVETLPLWFEQALVHRCDLTYRLVLRQQYMRQGWPRHFIHRPTFVFFSGRLQEFVGSVWIQCYEGQVLRWVCIVQTIQSVFPFFVGLFRGRTCWFGCCPSHLDLQWLFCRSWYLLMWDCMSYSFSSILI